MAHRGQLGLLLLLGLALFVAAGAERQLEAREGVFVGYKENDGSLTAEAEGAAGAEADVAAAADDSAAAAAGADGGDAAAAGNDAAAAEGDAAAGAAGTGDAAAAGADAEALAQKAGVVGRTVLLHTQFGPIRVKLLEELAPRTTALVWRLAEARGCRNCAFYR